MDPVKLYKEGSEKLVASLDAPAWLADGWGTEKPEPEAPAEEVAISASATNDAAIDTEASADAEVKANAKRK
jgi:hypothetical protein